MMRKNKGMDDHAARRWARADGGFSLLEFCVTVAVVATMVGILFPKLLDFADGARRRQAREDALCLGAAAALMVERGGFEPGEADAEERIRAEAGAETGAEFPGEIEDLTADGSFVYTREEGGKEYRVFFDAASLAVTDLPDGADAATQAIGGDGE